MGFRLKHFEAFCNSSNSIFAAVNLLLLCVYQIVDVATMSVIHSWATKRMFARPRNSTDADECKFDSLPYRFTFCLCTVQWTLNNAYMPSIFDFNLQRYFARTLFLFTVPFLSSLPSFRNFFFFLFSSPSSQKYICSPVEPQYWTWHSTRGRIQTYIPNIDSSQRVHFI